ncbi:2041_t:CDS:2 [Dentiscutata erythropus]|uniref:2041_t:CDS:1 n=1 Tax=Dentiscutata erythropus TaxID=1348616 RepID=A0A9N9NP27_9GLOM|nr:2041_t:CDS:2 [Dentiscutata erythropus]
MRLYHTGNRSQSTLLRQLFYEEFQSLFWLRPSDRNDYEHELNMSHNHRQQQLYYSESHSQPPSKPQSQPLLFKDSNVGKSKYYGLVYVVV